MYPVSSIRSEHDGLKDMCILAQQSHGKVEEKAKAARGRKLCLDADVLETWPEREMKALLPAELQCKRNKGVPEEVSTQKSELGSLSYKT